MILYNCYSRDIRESLRRDLSLILLEVEINLKNERDVFL